MPQSVRYGMQVRLRHVVTGACLKSLNRAYQHPNSSGQQMVIGSALKNEDTLWIVKGANESGSRYSAGEAVEHGDTVRLEHLTTHKNLHSHGGRLSPLTQQQEVTAYGEMGQGDNNDDWVVDLDARGEWYFDAELRLIHKSTQEALHSHPGGYVDPVYTAGEQEVTCLQRGDRNDLWVTATEDQLPGEKRFAGRPLLPKTWIDYLAILGSIASVTGWTLVTLKERLATLQFLGLLGYIFSSTLVLGALLIFTSWVARFYRRETFNPKPWIWRVGFWGIAATLYVLILLLSWRISVWAANHAMVPFLKWIFGIA